MMTGDSKNSVTKMTRGKAHFRDQTVKGWGGTDGGGVHRNLENLGSEKVKELGS